MRERKYLTRTEMERLVGAVSAGINEHRDKCMLLMCFIHGLRVSELAGLRVQDVEFSTKTIYISRLKNGFSVQHPIQNREMVFIRKWLEIRPQYLDSDSSWLFLSRHGGKLSRQQLYRLFRKYGENAGINVAVHPHMLRHACGYALADNGCDTRLIQDYLGHRSIQNTVIYTASNAGRFRSITL
ncbi:tyrosine-type recombinase/integrase [Rahnella sp. PD12R]|uniref:tyrosine-type DNA invertase n=1 Tax=Rahnella sp. PD12R TaxID=2855688 RepID=UPI001C44E967|nr:tyrosine-type DNA invertase [Rahnella sp. PD12R]MBV6817855.1 tyrosine-type recombinase/integrase [Rahnella sp. PD12R]